jgi:hypothetical protein
MVEQVFPARITGAINHCEINHTFVAKAFDFVPPAKVFSAKRSVTLPKSFYESDTCLSSKSTERISDRGDSPCNCSSRSDPLVEKQIDFLFRVIG